MAEEKELKVEDIKKSAEEKRCPVQKALFYIEGFLDGPMCGKCLPCALGTYEARIRLKDIIQGRGKDEDLVALRHIAEIMLGSSRCKKGKDTANYIIEWMKTNTYKAHIEGRCPDRECVSFIEYRIIPEKCNMCGRCKEVCKFAAIHGETAKPYLGCYFPFEIRQKKCVKCGECVPVCPTGAIIIADVKKGEPVGV